MIYARLLTAHRYVQEESVGDVDDGAAQQTEDVHMIQTVQVVQVSLRGGDANLHCLLQAWTCQSWKSEFFSYFYFFYNI